jgi:4-amino-4-deoxy-L-arabinose transferase-like glycosyltransferase
VPRRPDTADLGRLPLLGLAAVLVVAAALRAPLLGGGQIDYDEGVYWQSLRALAAGHALFASVYSSQPPGFLLLLLPAHLALGGGIAGARLAVLVLSLAGVAAAGRLAWVLGGPGAGLLAAGLLAADPLYFRASVTLQADGPSVALGLVGLAAAAEARARAGSRPALPLAVAAGAALATAALVKLLAVAALPPALVLLVAGPARARMAGAALLGGAAAAATLLLPFAGAWPALWDQAVGLHLGARSLPVGGLDQGTLLRGLPIAVLAVAGCAAAIGRRPLLAVTGATWAVACAGLLAVQHPLWPHHAVVLVAPLALLGGGLSTVVTSRAAAVAVACALAAASIASGSYSLRLQAPAAAEAPVVAALHARTAPGELVITDDQFGAALADRSTPPELVDTSFVRIASGNLTTGQVESIAGRPGVRGVLLGTGRLAAMPGLREWLAQRFPLVVDLGGGRTLYTRLRDA